MAIIYNYPLNSILLAEDMLIGTSTNIVNGQPKNATKNFSIADLTGFIKQNVSLNDVLQVGNTSLLDAKVGGLYLYDIPVADYGNIVLNQNRFSFNTVTHGEVFRAQRDMFSSFSSSGYRGSFEVSSITANRVWDLPNKPGTIALLSDIPPVVTQNLQNVTDIGSITTNTITVGSFLGDFSQVLSTAIGTQNHTTGTYAYLDSSGYLGLNNGTAESYLKNTDVTNINVILEFPNKPTGGYTIATLDDIPVITTPTLQEVTDAGAITTDSITVGEITSNYFIANDVDYNSEMAPGYFITTNAATTTFGILEFSQLVLETPASSIKMTATGITFPNASIQVTAFPPTGGTTSQYIKGNGTLGTFPVIPTTPTLQQVTDVGNTSTNEIVVGTDFSNGLTLNQGYVSIVETAATYAKQTAFFPGTVSTNFDDSLIGKSYGASLTADGGLYLQTFGSSGYVQLKSDLVTTAVRTIQFPDASGTLALTSNIGTWGALNYPVWTTGTPFVKMTAAGTFALDTNTYLTSITSSDVTTALGYTPVTNARTLTINGVGYDLTADRSWTIATGTGTVTSVGMTVPSAFSVTPSSITTSGTFAITGAGVASQYVRGDGTLANFPTSSGGGASVSYYLNGSVSQGTLGGVAYKEMNSVPIIGTGTDFTINADGYIAQFITDVGDPNKLLIPSGNWNFETYFSASSSGGSPKFYIELYKYNGATFTLIASNSTTPENITGGTAIDLYFTAIAVPPTTLLATDRLAVRFYVIHSGRTITMHTENSHLSQIITTFSTGLTALNGLTTQVQNLAVGTSGTDFAISSASATHTFDLPTASATNRGALSSADWTTFNNKQTALGFTPANDSNVVHLAQIETITGQKTFNPSVTAASAIAKGTVLTPTLVASANSDTLVGLDIAPTFTNGAFTGVSKIGLRIGELGITDSSIKLGTTTGSGYGTISSTGSIQLQAQNSTVFYSSTVFTTISGRNSTSYLALALGVTTFGQFMPTTGNLLLQNGGTFTDVPSSRLTVNSTTQGFLPPRMTTTQRNAIASPATGLLVYDTTLLSEFQYNGTAWVSNTLSYAPYKNIQTSQTAITGTLLETVAFTATIPAGTFNSTDVIKVLFGANKTTALGIFSLRIRLNTTNTIVGSTIIGSYSGTTSAQVNLMMRNFNLNGGNLYGHPFSSGSLTDIVAIGGALGSTTLNTSNLFYLFATLSLNSSSDSIIGNMFSIHN